MQDALAGMARENTIRASKGRWPGSAEEFKSMSAQTKIGWTKNKKGERGAPWNALRFRVYHNAVEIVKERGWDDLIPKLKKTAGHVGSMCHVNTSPQSALTAMPAQMGSDV